MLALRRCLLPLALFAALSSGSQLSAQQVQTDAPQIELLEASTVSSRPLLTVRLHNPTLHPLTLDLGITTGQGSFAGEVEFLLIDAQGKERRLVKRDPAFIAGAVAPYVITLPAGGAFDLPDIDLVDYYSYEPKIAVLALSAGKYRLTAIYKGHDPNQDLSPPHGRPIGRAYPEQFWIGTVRSDVLEFILKSPIGDLSTQAK